VSKRTYHPGRGDLVEMNFQPAAGREIDKRRPAIVLSPIEYNRRSGFCLAVPLTSDLTPGPMRIDMPAGYVRYPSLILCDFLKSFDYRERGATLITSVPEELVQEIVSNILDLIDPIR
jgi:mRNA interferase MazF